MNLRKKSQFAGIVLTVLFGPLGLIYSSSVWGVVLLVIAFLTAPTIIVPLLIWLVCIPIGIIAVANHNDSVKIFLENSKGSTNG